MSAEINTAHGELMRVYAELDRDVADIISRANARAQALGCRGCGTCCRFPPEGAVLYATSLERDLLASVPPGPGDHPEGSCPYLREGSCTARERRVVGCRSHFCPAALPALEDREACHAAAERAYAALAEITRRLDLEWDYAPAVERLRERGIS